MENGGENGIEPVNENGMENGDENGIERVSEEYEGKGKGKEVKDDKDLDYLSSSMFLTDDEDGYYYEKVQENRGGKRSKKKAEAQAKSEKVSTSTNFPSHCY